MEENSLSAKKRVRMKKEDAEENLMEESVQEDELESTPLASSTPVTGKRRGRPPKTATSVMTPDVKSMHVSFFSPISEICIVVESILKNVKFIQYGFNLSMLSDP